MSEKRNRLTDEERQGWIKIFNKLPKSTHEFLKDNPEKFDAWYRGFHDCIVIVKDEFDNIFKSERKR
jgi:hypothetical protein